MLIVILVLVIPLLGLAILGLDSQRQTALPFESRGNWTAALRIVGLLSLASGLVLLAVPLYKLARLALSIVNQLLSNGKLLESLDGSLFASFAIVTLMAGLGMVAMLTGREVFRLPTAWPSEDEDHNSPSVIERYTPLSLLTDPHACHMRSGAWVMLTYPLLYVIPILGVFGAFLLIIAAMAFSAYLQSRRAFQSQLLWLITIAVRNKLPLADEFRNLSKDKGVKLSSRLRLAAQDLDHGDTLSQALERHRLLPASTLSAIRVSEGGSRFEETLRRLAIHATDRLNTISLSRLSEVSIQLISFLGAWTLILGFLMYYIIPKLKEIFIGFNAELPKVTQALIQLGDDLFQASSVTVFWMGIGIALLAWHALRHMVGWSSLSFPLLMHWFPKRDAPEVLRALGGIASEQAALHHKILQLTDRQGRPDLGARYRRIAEALSRGEPLSDTLSAEGLLTPLQRDAVAAGERGGHLPFVLFSMAEAMEQREFRRSAYWAELLKPIAIVICGLITSFVAIALFYPLVKLLNDLS